MSLFQKTIIDKYLRTLNPESLNEKWILFCAHFLNPEIQENIKNSKEEQYQGEFLIDLFVNVLGYTKNPTPNFNLTTEYKNVKDSKKADGAIIINEKVLAIIELKGTDTTDLGKIENQAFGYKNNQADCKYVITSNFEKLRFYIDNAIEFLEFNLFELNKEQFDMLYLCLAHENIAGNIPAKIKNESVSQEDEITKKLYKDYSVFKRNLFQDLTQQNPEYDQLELFKKSQKLLDRFLFLFFGEDRGLLPPNSVRMILEQWQKLKDLDEYVPLYDRFKKYFGYLNTGFKGKQYDVFAYNGGLFKPDEILDNITIDDDLLAHHTIKLADYNFASDVDVNILGHIFENSLNEIDEIKAQLEGKEIDKSKTKRKKDGVFYTPKYITKYIVENTVGKLCEEKKAELGVVEEDYFTDKKRQQKTKLALLQKLQDYRTWLHQVTIIDPACGSGAFLNEALNFLIEEHKYIDELEAKLTGSSIAFTYHSESILENNLFGVDLNEESVEIAKLSLWLRTAEPNRKLNDLSNNIKCGNSLIDDPEIAGEKAFNWDKEFPQVFAKGGFDVVIGNPPYVSVKEIPTEHKLFYIKQFKTSKGQFDLYTLFFEKGYTIVKNYGIISFISPNTFISNKDYYEFRKFIIKNNEILEILNLGETVFKDANLDVSILSFVKHKKFNKSIKIIKSRPEFDSNFFSTLSQETLIEDNYNIRINLSDFERKILDTIYNESTLLSEILDLPRGIEFGSNSEKIFKEKKENSHKIIFGKNISRYEIQAEENYCFYENNLSVFKDLKIYLSDKILIQRIRNLSLKRRIIAAFDDKKHLCTNTLRIGILTNKSFNLKYILSVLNSNLINFLFLKQFLNKDIYSFQLQQIPIKEISLKDQQPFIEKVDEMLSLNKELQEISAKFQRTLQREFSLETLSKKLQNWYDLSFSEFLKELVKLKINLSLSQKAEWEDYFLQEQKRALDCHSKVTTTDKEIDKMVYQLYELTDEEIEIVEKQ